VAVLHSQTSYFRFKDRQAGRLYDRVPAGHPMEGAVHAVLENGLSADILNEEALLARMAEYPVVVVPEQEDLPGEVADRLRDYVRTGGQLLLSGAHVAQTFPDLMGVEAVADRRLGTSWVPAGDGCVSVPGPWQAVKLGAATEIAPLLHQQERGLDRAGTAAATVNPFGKGTVVAIHGPVFRSYYQSHYPGLRRFIGSARGRLDSGRLISLEGPWWIEMSARKKDDRLLIQFVNRSSAGHLAPDRHVVEGVPDAGPFSLTVPMKQEPTRCYTAPDDAGLEWTWSDGLLTAKIAGLDIHNVLVIEK
jgi:hypothetical protein